MDPDRSTAELKEEVSCSSFRSLSRDEASIKKGEETFENLKGLGWFVTGLFVAGELVGGGIVALPTSIIQTGFVPGLIIMITMILIAAFTSFLLGKSWSVLLEMWPEYREHTRKPYAEIGFRANGGKMKTIVSIVTNVTQLMSAVVCIELASKNIVDFIKAFFNVDVSFCLVVIVVAICLLPLTFLKSPSDFWWAVVIAMFTTTGAVILIVIGSSIDYGTCAPIREVPAPRVTSYFLSIGTILFSVGGHTAFPTIQHDMRRPKDFTKSTIVAFSIMLLMYIPTAVLGYLSYGGSLRDSVINSIQTMWIQQAINILITLHLFLTLIIVFNPLMQETEELFKVPHHFCWQRVVVRTSIMALCVFVAESIPSFGPLLNLVGGSTFALTAIIFPCIFFIFLEARRRKTKQLGTDEGPVTIKEVFRYNDRFLVTGACIVIVVGMIGGGAATFSALRDLATVRFEPPCYVSAFSNNNYNNSTLMGHDVLVGATNCCGLYQNVTSIEGVICSEPHLNFHTQL